jgi:hypothetical protein
VFSLKPPDLDGFTSQQIRTLADRADEIIKARNRIAEQNGKPDG